MRVSELSPFTKLRLIEKDLEVWFNLGTKYVSFDKGYRGNFCNYGTLYNLKDKVCYVLYPDYDDEDTSLEVHFYPSGKIDFVYSRESSEFSITVTDKPMFKWLHTVLKIPEFSLGKKWDLTEED